MTSVIDMKNINKSYGKEPNLVEVLKGVSLKVDRGEFVAILGPSGSGKTTLMNIIGLIDTLDSGKYLLDDINIKNQFSKEYSRLRNEKIGFIFQKFNLISKYTALHNVTLPLLYRGEKIKTAREKAKKTLETVGLGDRSHHRPNELSGGQQQRVAIARALVGDCSLILADEPTGNLDQKTGAEVIDMLIKLNNQGKTIVLITHDLNVASKAKRIIHVQDGMITG